MAANQPSSIHSRLTDGYLLLLMTLNVFLFSSAGYLGIVDVKWKAFLALSGGYVCLSLLLYGEELLIGRRKLSDLRRALRESGWTERLLALYLVFTLLSALLCPDPAAAWRGASRREGALTISLYVLSALLIARFGRPRPWMAHALALTVAAQAVLCLAQLAGGNPFGLYPDGVNYFDAGTSYSGAFLGTVGNVDFLGAYFALALPVLWAAILRMRSRSRWLYLIPLALSAVVVVKMWVLSCLVGLLLGGAAALPVVLPAGKRVRLRLALGLVLAAVLAIGLLWLVDVGAGALHTLHQILRGHVPQSVDSGRLYIWRETLRRVPEHLLFGVGPDRMGQVGIEPFRRVDESLGLLLYGWIDAAHNEYLNILFHQGIFALLAYLGALVSAARSWLRAAQGSPAAAILGAAAASYALQAFFNISMFFTASLFWACLGLLERAAAEPERKHKDKNDRRKT